MTLVDQTKHRIQPMKPEDIASIAAFEQRQMALPQIKIHTQHILHAGMYARTIIIPAGVRLTGALIKIPTMVIVSGDALIIRGENDGLRVTGAAVLPAGAGRKQVFAAIAETTVTMLFPTSATTAEQAEEEFTDEADMLFSRLDPELNTIIITGE